MNPGPREGPRPAGAADPAQNDAAGHAVRRGLVALATAAVVSVYAAGYVRTDTAAAGFQGGDGARRGGAESAPGSESALASESAPGSEAKAPGEKAPAASTEAPAALAEAPAPASASPTPEGTPAAPLAPPASSTAAVPEAAPAGAPYKDGLYTGWGSSPHGRIEATVEVQGGRILSATISSCRMRWPCARIAYLVPQVAERQSAEVDVISRVTDSSDAFYYALVEALSKAK